MAAFLTLTQTVQVRILVPQLYVVAEQVDAYQSKGDRSKAVVTKRLKNPFRKVNPSINASM